MAAPTDTPTPVSLPANAVELRGLTKIYQPTGKAGPKHALKGIDLAIPRGSLFGLLGPNGGATTSCANCTPAAAAMSIWPRMEPGRAQAVPPWR